MKITIKKSQKEELEGKIKKIEKKVNVVVNSINEYSVKKHYENNIYQVKYLDYDIDFSEIYKIEGYEYLGGLKNKDGSNIFFGDNEKLVNEVDDNLIYECYHCHKKTSNRVSKFYFQKTDTNEIVHFGSTCVKAYFGIDVFNAINVVSRFVNDYSDDNEFFDGKGKKPTGYDHALYIDFLIEYFSMGHSYTSKSKAGMSGLISTANMMKHMLFNKEGRKEAEKQFESYNLVYNDIKRIRKEIYQYFEVKIQYSNFDYNLKNAFSDFSDKSALIAYGVFEFYNSFKIREEEIIKTNYNNFVHYDNDNIENEKVTCVKIGSCNTQYGVSRIVNFENNCYKFVWFTTVNIDKIVEGNEYTIKKGIIKSRDIYKGIKNNIIKTRVNNII